jgi:hypothetical protein
MDLSGFSVNEDPAHCAPPTLSGDSKDSGGDDIYFQFNNTFGEFTAHQLLPLRAFPELSTGPCRGGQTPPLSDFYSRAWFVGVLLVDTYLKAALTGTTMEPDRRASQSGILVSRRYLDPISATNTRLE